MATVGCGKSREACEGASTLAEVVAPSIVDAVGIDELETPTAGMMEPWSGEEATARLLVEDASWSMRSARRRRRWRLSQRTCWLLSEGRNGMSNLEWGLGRVTSGGQKSERWELTSVTKKWTKVSTKRGREKS